MIYFGTFDGFAFPSPPAANLSCPAKPQSSLIAPLLHSSPKALAVPISHSQPNTHPRLHNIFQFGSLKTEEEEEVERAKIKNEKY